MDDLDLLKEFMNDLGDMLKPSHEECHEEAQWIYDNAFAHKFVSQCVQHDPVLGKVYRRRDDEVAFITAIEMAVRLLRWEDHFDERANCHYSGPREVPFIAQYRKEAVCYPEVLNLHGEPSAATNKEEQEEE